MATNFKVQATWKGQSLEAACYEGSQGLHNVARVLTGHKRKNCEKNLGKSCKDIIAQL